MSLFIAYGPPRNGAPSWSVHRDGRQFFATIPGRGSCYLAQESWPAACDFARQVAAEVRQEEGHA